MKWILKTLRGMQVFLSCIAILVLIDMIVLGGKIKLWIIAIANTTSSSPFSSDGQMNWILILIIIVVIFLSVIVYDLLRGSEEDEKKIN